MKRKLYRCPSCDQTSSRKWNLETHIGRKHSGAGIPIDIISPYRSINENARVGPSSKSYAWGEHYSRFAYRGDAKPPPKRDTVRETLEDVRNFMELMGVHNSPKTFDLGFMPHLATFQNWPGRALSRQPFVFDLRPEAMRDCIVGFRSHMCKECISINPLPLFAFPETNTSLLDIVHKCDEKRISEIMSLTELERHKKGKEIFPEFPKEMSKAIQTLWINHTDPYLLALKLEKPSSNAYDITRLVDDTDRWLYRSIKRGAVVLEQNELEDFLFLAFGNTFCEVQLVRGHGELAKQEAYLLVLSRDSKLHSLFSSYEQGSFERYMQNGWASFTNNSPENSTRQKT